MSHKQENNYENVHPLLPEIDVIEPLVQCGVLYLGTVPVDSGLRGLQSIQEPFSHRYPVDGTNTVRGIDAALSIYENGIQLAFTRQPHAVVFFPITSLLYCASVRFSIVTNSQNSSIDWRFLPLDPMASNQDNKHPPLFCVVTHRTNTVAGDECHCFITKSVDASVALVRSVTEIYTTIKSITEYARCPIFYQLDRYGRKLSEINGVIYLSPANSEQSSRSREASIESSMQNYLLDSSLGGFFYRTEASVIEFWQLWENDDDLVPSRPRPPPSPFGLHEGLYHDDTTHDIQRYLRQMEEHEDSNSCSCSDSPLQSPSRSRSSSKSSRTSIDSIDTQTTEAQADGDEFNLAMSDFQVSSFEPHINSPTPIIIEKVQPKSTQSIPVVEPTFIKTKRSSKVKGKQPQMPLPAESEIQQVNYVPKSDPYPVSYFINERGEKITKDGNRLIFMDVIQPIVDKKQKSTKFDHNQNLNRTEKSYRKRSTQIPMMDIESVERLFQEKKLKKRRKSLPLSEAGNHQNQIESIDLFKYAISRRSEARERKGSTSQFLETASRLDRLIPSINSIPSIKNSSQGTSRKRETSMIKGGPSPNYSHQASILTPSDHSAMPIHSLPSRLNPSTAMTDEQLNEYVSKIYGTSRSIRSSSRSTVQPPTPTTPLIQSPPMNGAHFASALRYMPNFLNSLMLREYRNAY